MKFKAIRALGMATGLILFVAVPAFPHGGGIIRVASKQVEVGGTIALTGEKLEKNADLSLELRGILDNYPAGRVRADASGRVSMKITIPPAVPIGAYTLVAIAVDGDVVARTPLLVVPPADAAVAAAGMPHMGTDSMPGMTGLPGMTATAEMMKIDRVTTTGEWIVITTLILLSFAGGALLLLRTRKTRT